MRWALPLPARETSEIQSVGGATALHVYKSIAHNGRPEHQSIGVESLKRLVKQMSKPEDASFRNVELGCNFSAHASC